MFDGAGGGVFDVAAQQGAAAAAAAAAAGAAPQAAQAAPPQGLVDTRLLGKPPTLAGREGEFVDWQFVVKSYLCMVDTRFWMALELVEVPTEDAAVVGALNA